MTKDPSNGADRAIIQYADGKPTREMYDQLVVAYDHFNKSLFDGALPPCLITLQRSKKSYGYFRGKRFASAEGQLADEIALNPAHFKSRAMDEVLATLVHEMVHLWQHHFGAPGRGRYHNREWAEKMKAVGLQPTADGAEGGAETGEAMSHLIISGGAFEKAAAKLLAKSFSLSWTDYIEATVFNEAAGGGKREAETPSKAGKWFKFECPVCKQSARAKYEAALVCGNDRQVMARIDP